MTERIFQQFHHNLLELAGSTLPSTSLAIAVSGGSDSMALLMLAKEWADLCGVNLFVLTVDHHLRLESSEEAEYVAAICASLNLTHKILHWNWVGAGNVQALAREARYQLMTNFCHDNNITILVTAHHLDDQVENFFIRLSRASGLFGLLDHRIGLYNRIKILRPLFNIPKRGLQEYLRDRGVEWREDASNKNLQYKRSSIRQWLEQMPAELDPELFKRRVLKSQQHLSSAAKYIQAALDKELQNNVVFYENYAEYNIRGDGLIEHMTLAHILGVIGRQDREPRGESVALLRSRMRSGARKMTLHGCLVKSSHKEGKICITISIESGKKKSC